MELFNIDWQRSKLLNSLKTKLDHGHSIFVEKNNLKETKFEDLAWHKAITGEQDNFRLYINASEVGIASGQESF